MTIRTIRKTIAFRRPFYLKGVDRLLRPGEYSVITDEELHRGTVVLGLPSRINVNFRACAVWIRDRDGDDRAFGP